MSNRKQSSQTKPLYVKDRIEAAHWARSSEAGSWDKYMSKPPVILGGPQVTERSLDLLAGFYVTHWETWKHANERGVTVDRATGIEVMGIKQPLDALWGFTVYPMAQVSKPATKPASAKPKAIVTRSKPKAIAKPLPQIKRKAKLGKIFSYQAEYQAALARSQAGKGPSKPPGYQNSKDQWVARGVICSVSEMGFTAKQIDDSWNAYIDQNPKANLVRI